MNVKRFIGAFFALFVFIFLFEWLFHGILLMDQYQETIKVWRDFSEMESNIPLSMCFQFALSAWIVYLFTQFYPNGGLANGVLYGFYIGVLAGILSASWYLYLPIPASLGLGWFIGSVVEGLGGGVILGFIYRE